SVAPLGHRRNTLTAHFDRSEAVCLERFAEAVERRVEHIGRLEPQNRRVVDDDVDGTELFLNSVMRRLDAGHISHIHPDGDRRVAWRMESVERSIHGGLIAPGQGDPQPFREQLPARFKTQSAIRTRDEGNARSHISFPLWPQSTRRTQNQNPYWSAILQR